MLGEELHFTELSEMNIRASKLMASLCQTLSKKNPQHEGLDVFLIQLLYCLFANSTQIFTYRTFKHDVLNTREDGADIGPMIALLFQRLGGVRSPEDGNYKKIPYLNGGLFGNKEQVVIPSFDSHSRNILLRCCDFNWSEISPAIFGSLFQNLSDPRKKRALGEYYTREDNILKVLNPLFLDSLHKELNKATNFPQLEQFLKKLPQLKFLDPACGCGNFLVIAYRELRRIELEALRQLYKKKQSESRDLDIDFAELSQVNVAQFYGIEIAPIPAKIAQVALWLTDHQMNMELKKTFGEYKQRIPLTHGANIQTSNALRLDWQELIPAQELNYIMGNPPFVGYQLQNAEQTQDIATIFNATKGAGKLDYVACWYKKSVGLMKQNNKIVAAFVSSNSISQGSQVSPLWTDLLAENVCIHFAHRTFTWDNEAGGKAAVHCVIIGFALFDIPQKQLWDYFGKKGSTATKREVSKINPYLLATDNILVEELKNPISPGIPNLLKGNQPTDGGSFLFTTTEKDIFLESEPGAEKFFRPLLGADEFINNTPRFCLWLKDVPPSELSSLPRVRERIESVRKFRLGSKKTATRKLADTPALFAEIRQPKSDYLLVPSVSSERRVYIPIGYIDKVTIVTNSVFTVENATPYLFGLLTSIMHMTWVKYVCGRLKSDYRYSNTLGYNTFPFPINPRQAHREKITEFAKNLLSLRAAYLEQGQNYAQLYNPTLMPPDLVKAHKALDKAVDSCYRFKDDTVETGSDAYRIEFLFQKYFEQTKALLHPKTDL